MRAKHTQQGEVTKRAVSWSLTRKGLGENDDGGEGRKRTAPHVEVGGAPCASESARGGRTAKSPSAPSTLWRSVALQYGQPSMTYDIASVVTLPGNGFYDEVITGNITGNYQW